MASRNKTGKNQRDFLNQLGNTTMLDLAPVQEEKVVEKEMDSYLKKTDKQITHLPIDKLVPAPKEWNFFPKLEDDKFIQLKMSIMNNGILQALIVWEQDDGTWMILSGHNRVAANKEIIAEYSDCDHKFDYTTAPCIVYAHDEIDENKAREIIIDTNYIQRGQFKPKLRVLIIQMRMDLMKKQIDEKGRRIDKLAEDLGIKKSSIYEDIAIGTKLIPEIQELFYSGKLNRKAVLKFTNYVEDTQKELYDKYGDKMTSKNVMQLTKSMKMNSDFEKVFNDQGKQPMRTVSLEIPESEYEAFMEAFKKYKEARWGNK